MMSSKLVLTLFSEGRTDLDVRILCCNLAMSRPNMLINTVQAEMALTKSSAYDQSLLRSHIELVRQNTKCS